MYVGSMRVLLWSKRHFINEQISSSWKQQTMDRRPPLTAVNTVIQFFKESWEAWTLHKQSSAAFFLFIIVLWNIYHPIQAMMPRIRSCSYASALFYSERGQPGDLTSSRVKLHIKLAFVAWKNNNNNNNNNINSKLKAHFLRKDCYWVPSTMISH